MTRVLGASLCGLVLLVSLIGCSTDVKIENPNFQSSEAKQEQPNAAADEGQVQEAKEEVASAESGVLGQALAGDGYEVTLNSARFDSGSGFIDPSNDYFLIYNFTFTNTSSEDLSISSWGNFELQGADLYIYSTAIGAETRGSLDSTVLPGKSLRGEIAFDVPLLASYELRFKPELFSGKSVIFNLSESDIERN